MGRTQVVCSLPELLQETGNGTYPLEELREGVFLIWSVQIIVWQTKSHQYNRHTQDLVEKGRDGDRATFTNKNGVFAVDFAQSSRGSLHRWRIYGNQYGFTAMQITHRHLDSWRSKFFHAPFEQREYFGRLQIGWQAQADLGFSHGGDDRLGSLAYEAADNTMHLQGWTCPETLEWGIFIFTGQLRDTHLLT